MAEPVLRKGSNDPAVRDLQQALKALGHDPGPADGVFGNATESAVKAFQQEREITVDGMVGKVTWINIDEADQSEPVLRVGSTGLPVRRAQKRMSLVGFDVGGVDGRYGPRPSRRSRICSSDSTSPSTGWSAHRPGPSSTLWRTKARPADWVSMKLGRSGRRTRPPPWHPPLGAGAFLPQVDLGADARRAHDRTRWRGG